MFHILRLRDIIIKALLKISHIISYLLDALIKFNLYPFSIKILIDVISFSLILLIITFLLSLYPPW